MIQKMLKNFKFTAEQPFTLMIVLSHLCFQQHDII